jgi:hypothetical protein
MYRAHAEHRARVAQLVWAARWCTARGTPAVVFSTQMISQGKTHARSTVKLQLETLPRDESISPLPVLDAEQISTYRARFEAYEKANSGWYELSNRTC